MSDRGPLTTENYQYRLDEERRNHIRQAVAQERLADLARQNQAPQPDRFLMLTNQVRHALRWFLARAAQFLQLQRTRLLRQIR